MGDIAIYLIVGILLLAGLLALSHASSRTMSEKEYESRKGKNTAVGNALLNLQSMIEPGKARLREAKMENRARGDPDGDPPDPETED